MVTFKEFGVGARRICRSKDTVRGPSRIWVFLVLVVAIQSRAGTHLYTWSGPSASPPPGATNIVSVSGGDGHVVALRNDGTVFSWGQNDYGQATVPLDVTNAVAIAAGSTHSLALLDDGTLRFWGEIYSTGVTSPPPAAVSNLVALAPGPTAQHVLCIRFDGAAVEWGNNSYGLTNVPSRATNLLATAVASRQSLALRADGTVQNWGQYYPSGAPSVPADATNVVAVAAGSASDLALRADGTLLGWGGSTGFGLVPSAATNITAIASSSTVNLALRADGRVLSWPAGTQTNNFLDVSNVVAIAGLTSGGIALSADDGPPLLGRALHATAAVGLTARLPALAISTTPLSYQWMYGSTNLPYGTNATLVLPSAQFEQAGNYTLVVSNQFGSVTNSGFSLAVFPLVIQTPPQDQTTTGGGSATFMVTALGQGLSYQWQFNGTNLSGATRSALVLANVQTNQAGPYAVTVSNAYATVTSSSAILNVVPLLITNQPQPQLACVGGQATFNVKLSGKGPFVFQWQLFGTNLPSGTNIPLVLTNVQTSDAGPYSVIVANPYGAVRSASALLEVVPILVTLQPQTQTAFLGADILLTAGSQASQSLTCQWEFNGSLMPGATGTALSLTNCQYAQSGAYQAVFQDEDSTTNTQAANLSVVQVACWGGISQNTVPPYISNMVAISASDGHSLGLRADGTVFRWGSGTNVPADLTNIVALSAGTWSDLVLRADGSVFAWGTSPSGQTNVPAGLTDAIAVSAGVAGGLHELALRSDGTVVAWGSSSNGQTNVPPGLTNVVAIAAGTSHSLALRSDGTVVAWGDNSSGELNVPIGLTNAVAIAAGNLYSLALTSDGSISAWGNNSYGVTNLPVAITNVVRLAAGANFCLALDEQGTVMGWGNQSFGTTTVPAELKEVIGIAAGTSHSLALVAENGTPGTAPISQAAWTTNGFTVSLPSRSGRVYRLEYKDSLSDVTWTRLPLVAGSGHDLTLRDPSATVSHRFYRVKVW